MANQRSTVHAYLTEEAHAKWHGFAATNGVSVSALIEALAAELPEGEPSERQTVGLARLVVAARKVDAVRRRQ
jgi:hypothetical protein